jgi:hypothetical protein
MSAGARYNCSRWSRDMRDGKVLQKGDCDGQFFYRKPINNELATYTKEHQELVDELDILQE